MEFEYNKPEDTAVELPIVEATEPVVEKVEEPEVEAVVVVEEAPAVVEQPKKKASKDGLVAIYSPKKVAWDGVGVLSVGINNVTKEDADKWLAAKYYVRLVEESK